MGLYAFKTSDADDAKILRAFGLRLGLGRDATQDEVSQVFADQLAEIVLERDKQDNLEAANAAVVKIDTTVGADAVAKP